ncbi:MAG: F0F1 ATP synthase subunit A [Anaerolineae bacterium]|nr:F0F1 ATP synthase subunit A [Anaerolineae bacterium]
METTRKWRYGVNRWIVLLTIILGIIGVNIAAPVRPHIQVAPEVLSPEPLFTLPVIGDFYLTNTMIAMFIGDVIIILIALAVRAAARRGSLVPAGISNAIEGLMEVVYNLTETSAGRWAKTIFPWFMTILLLVLVANLLKILPGVESIGVLHHLHHGHEIEEVLPGVYTVLPEEAEGEGYVVTPFVRGLSTDLNFTVALALISVFMTQVIGVRAQGAAYFLKFANVRTLFSKPFFGAMDFIVGLLELISEFAKILSFSFRLFGVMFSGVVLVALVATMLPVFMPSFVYMFEVFMALIQAFVFGMLTMVFMSQATQGHGAEEHTEH